MTRRSVAPAVTTQDSPGELTEVLARGLALARAHKLDTLVQLLAMAELELRMQKARISTQELAQVCDTIEAMQAGDPSPRETSH